MSWIITGTEAAPQLLDAYPGAAAAYSLRNLSWAYGGPVVRVRRSSDNTEQDFTATQITDGTLTAFCGAGDGFVRTWYDQSGNNRHAQQTTTSLQPTIVSSGSLLLDGGKPSISHSGIKWMSTAWGLLTGAVPQTIIGVYGKGTGDSDYISWGASTVTELAGLGITNANKFRATIAEDINTIDASAKKAVVINTFNGTVAAGNSKLWVNSSLFEAAAGSQSTTSTDLYIGIRSNLNKHATGISQEYIIYPLDLTVYVAGIEANINAHYSIF